MRLVSPLVARIRGRVLVVWEYYGVSRHIGSRSVDMAKFVRLQ
jgi:hypothetical protein